MVHFQQDKENKVLKDMTDFRRPFDANIQKMPKKPLTKRQKESFVKKYLRDGIAAYRSRVLQWNLSNDFENPKAPNSFLFGYDPEEIVKNTKKLKKEISVFEGRLERIAEKHKKKGLTQKETEKREKYEKNLADLQKELKLEEAKWNIPNKVHRSAYGGDGDDIGQEATIFFYRCLERFDVSIYQGNISNKNHENKGVDGKIKTPKTLDFYFKHFLFQSITNLSLDTVKRNVATNQKIFTYGDSKTVGYSPREVVENNININDCEKEYRFNKDLKLEVIKRSISSIDSDEERVFALARIYQKKDVVIKMYGEHFQGLEDWYQSWRHDTINEFDEELKRA